MIGFHPLLRRILPLVFLLYSSASGAAEIVPFAIRNQTPLVLIFGLPAIGDASLAPARKIILTTALDVANQYVSDANSREKILLDGESTRFALEARYGIGDRFEAGVQIPFLWVSGGFLDGFLEGYHSTFGFPRGGRDQAPRNRLLYRYEKDNVEKLKLEGASSGLGDISLTGGWQIVRSASWAAALRGSLKFPTGASGLRGSGSTDAALWVTGRGDRRLGGGSVGLFGGAGIMGLTKGKVLEDQQRHFVGFGNIGAGWSPVHWIAFKAQIDAHTPFFDDSDLRALAANSAMLTLGGTLAFSPKTSLDIGVSEDINVATAPDVVFHFALRHRF